MSKHLEEIIERHFPEQPQVYPNRDKARAAILEYAAWEASFLEQSQTEAVGQSIAYWKNRARQAEARLTELTGSELVRTSPRVKYLGDPSSLSDFAKSDFI